MMKMDGRDSAECENWEKRDIMVILEFVFNDNKTKWNSDLLHLKKEKIKCAGGSRNGNGVFLVRESLPSL